MAVTLWSECRTNYSIFINFHRQWFAECFIIHDYGQNSCRVLLYDDSSENLFLQTQTWRFSRIHLIWRRHFLNSSPQLSLHHFVYVYPRSDPMVAPVWVICCQSTQFNQISSFTHINNIKRHVWTHQHFEQILTHCVKIWSRVLTCFRSFDETDVFFRCSCFWIPGNISMA